MKESQQHDQEFLQTALYEINPKFRKVIDAWIKFWGCVFFIGVFVNFLEVVTRVFFSATVDLMYDIPVWCTIWSTVMVCGPILIDNEHVSIDALMHKLKGKSRKIVSILNALFTLSFGVILTVAGYLSVSKLYQFGTTYPRSIPISSWCVEICVPIGMFIFSCFALYDCWKKFKLEASPDKVVATYE